MEWLDGKLSDDDKERLCSIINTNIATYKDEVALLQAILAEVPVVNEIEKK